MLRRGLVGVGGVTAQIVTMSKPSSWKHGREYAAAPSALKGRPKYVERPAGLKIDQLQKSPAPVMIDYHGRGKGQQSRVDKTRKKPCREFPIGAALDHGRQPGR